MDLKNINLTLKLLVRALDELIYNPTEKNEKDGLSYIQESCLRFIYYHNSPSQNKPLAKEVAEGLMVSNAAATKLLDRLVNKGYIIREFSTVDRRQVALSLTTDGEEVILAREREQEKKIQAILNRLSSEDQKNFLQGLKSFMEAALVDKETIDRICLRCGWSHRADCPGNQIYNTLTGEDKTNV